mmetsp:Transcript_6860/g.22145  ORF Transcript_6860/g.22145 Transcript_6860/m.22145 type:complete len:214 (+) Transcript_6860:435-1076(+)
MFVVTLWGFLFLLFLLIGSLVVVRVDAEGALEVGARGGGEEDFDGGVEGVGEALGELAGAGEEVDGLPGDGDDGGEEDDVLQRGAGYEGGAGREEAPELEGEDGDEVEEDGVPRGEAGEAGGAGVGGEEVEEYQGAEAREGDRLVGDEGLRQSRGEARGGPRGREGEGEGVEEGQQVDRRRHEADRRVGSVGGGFERAQAFLDEGHGFLPLLQ